MPAEIQFQPRDLAILRSLFESRVMTAAHIASLHFNGKSEAAKKRLQKIKAAGLVMERPRFAYEPATLFLTRKGFKFLEGHGILKEYPAFSLPALEKRARVSAMTLRHELEVMDVKSALCPAIRKSQNFQVVEFTTWPLLNQFEAFRAGFDGQEVTVRPDSFIRIHETANNEKFSHEFFLELDRSTEAQETLVARAGCYLEYYKSGGYAEKNGAARSDYKEYPFRVLMVFKNAERRNNTAERLLRSNPPILTLVWLTTLDEVLSDPLGAIWIRPTEYRDVTKSTPFDPDRIRDVWGYRRQTERELLVDAKVKKLRLFS